MPDLGSNEVNRNAFEFICTCCGRLHIGSPSYGYDRPIFYYDVTEQERGTKIDLDADSCAIEGNNFFIRSTLDIPIIGASEPFCWGLWISQSQENFLQYRATKEKDNRGKSTFGWIAVTMPGYEGVDDDGSLIQLKATAHWQDQQLRPQIVLEPCEHQLYLDQSRGISWERASEIAQLMPH